MGPVVPYFGVATQAPVQGSLLFRAAGAEDPDLVGIRVDDSRPLRSKLLLFATRRPSTPHGHLEDAETGQDDERHGERVERRVGDDRA